MKRKFQKNDNKPCAYSNPTTSTFKYEGKPANEGKVNELLSVKALKDLVKSSFSVIADPYTASLPESQKYPIVNTFLKHVGGNYKGLDNIDGGNVQQYAQSVTSRMLHCFDVLRLKVDLNYRYMPMKAFEGGKEWGTELINEMRKSIAETVSVLLSTTFHSLAINSYAIETDLPMGDAKVKSIANGATPINAYTNITDVIYGMSMYYQTFFQEALTSINWYNSFRMKQGTMIRNAWNREVPNLNSLFGLLNKTSFVAVLQSIAGSFQGEFIDKDFAVQTNMITFTPSRRSNSMMDPVLELQAGFNHPSKFKVYVLGNDGKIADPDDKPIFDDAADLLVATPDGDVSFWQACGNIRDYLSLEATTLWARKSYQSEGMIPNSDSTRFNFIKAQYDVIRACMTVFKPAWADYRECLDTMTRTGSLSWYKGFVPEITMEKDASLFYNTIVHDVFKMVMSGADKVLFDDYTKRTRTFSLWNLYEGIPTYDVKQGGAFLSFSSKNLDNLGEEQRDYLPLAFNPWMTGDTVNMAAVNRLGKEVLVTYKVVTMATNPILSRLVPLQSQNGLEVRVPYAVLNANTEIDDVSAMYHVLTSVFGLCCLPSALEGVDYAIDPDIIAVYQLEIEDMTNAASSYARIHAPFRGTSDDSDNIIGFFGGAISSK